MEIRGICAFVAVAETGSVTLAAQQLGYTQSAISRQLAAFETSVGVRLFERARDGMALTSDGRSMLPIAVEIVRLSTRLRDLPPRPTTHHADAARAILAASSSGPSPRRPAVRASAIGILTVLVAVLLDLPLLDISSALDPVSEHLPVTSVAAGLGTGLASVTPSFGWPVLAMACATAWRSRSAVLLVR